MSTLGKKKSKRRREAKKRRKRRHEEVRKRMKEILKKYDNDWRVKDEKEK